ncbi:V-type ATP synthase subunit D [Eubacterium aggregans]|uniref:V-type ATP synthase subunit D n=2 Tax=Eubacterium aggregans TaxID=81409 RepID=UPI003F2ADE47
MALKITPTKANLIKSKARLSFSTKGYNLLDKKRTVLIQEIMKLVQQSEEIETQIGATFKEAYIALQQVTISMGLNHLDEFTLSIPPETPFDTRTRSVMGVDIPELVIPESAKESLNLPYGFYENNPALDVAIAKFNEVKELSYRLAEIEGTAFKLSVEIKKTQKSANALDKIQIPKLKTTIKYIEESIEEKDREENFRIKKIKEHNQK